MVFSAIDLVVQVSFVLEPKLTLVQQGPKITLPRKVNSTMLSKVLPWVEAFYFKKKRFPTDGEWLTRFNFPGVSLQDLKLNPLFRKACMKRGISYNPLSESGQDSFQQLLPEQVAVISVMTNFADTRPTNVKLATLGISPAMLNGWMADPFFKSELAARADETLDNIYPDAVNSLSRRIKQGNVTAIKFYFDLTGRAQTPELVNLKLAMQHLIEAVQKHVKDPETLAAIAADFTAVSQIRAEVE